MDASLQTALLATQANGPAKPPAAAGNAASATKAAKEFEGVFISQFLGSMFSGISTDGPFGGGQGEEMFRSLMINEYSKSVVSRGGFGLADSVAKQLLKNQEIPHTVTQ